MSEKRISVHQYNHPCEKCAVKCDTPDTDCDFYSCYMRAITRTDAVERMAKAIYFKACGTMKHYAKCKKEYIPFAKAALDALLE